MTDTMNSQRPREFYASFQTARDGPLHRKFNDIDDADQFRDYERRLRDQSTENFVLDFGDEDAWCATDLEAEDFKLLLSKPKSKCFGTRWINIWKPEEQKEIIRTITTYYGVSERLQGMMYTEPVPQRPPRPPTLPEEKLPLHSGTPVDVENAYPLNDVQGEDAAQESAPFRDLSFAQLFSQIWHFSSVDHGPRYTCIGYNSLYVIPNHDMSNGEHFPEGKRLLCWLVLCDDGTVISIQENPFPRAHGSFSPEEVNPVLNVVRRNIRFIFHGISKQASATTESNSLITVRVRRSNVSESDRADIKQEEGPSLLFYYIFDDWIASYSLIVKREHGYGAKLEELRNSMLKRPEIELVNKVHRLGRQLAVLKRLYQSYELIMRRVLQRQRLLRDEVRFPYSSSTLPGAWPGFRRVDGGLQLGHTGDFSYPGANASELESVGVRLSPVAVVRFERLADRINLYCLNEIEACLLEKESLTFMNFNLIALKDSQAVEKLTRITILLAKVTILFLPVSLMTGYFSTELQGVKSGYTIAEYWASFGVIMAVTVLVLAAYGYMSDTVEGKTIYQSVVRGFLWWLKDRVWGLRLPRGGR